jgi:N-acetylglucosamine kinase-like BadF-type ATPase
VLHLFHNRQRPAPVTPDRLTAILLDEAERGDEVALRVVRDHGATLGNIAMAAARQVGLDGASFPLVLAGGVFRHSSSALADAIVARVRITSPDAWLVRPLVEPVAGVVVQALALAGVIADERLRDRVISTLPADVTLAALPT